MACKGTNLLSAQLALNPQRHAVNRVTPDLNSLVYDKSFSRILQPVLLTQH